MWRKPWWLLFVSTPVFAEPSVGGGHGVVLILLVGGLAMAIALAPLILKRFSKTPRSMRNYWNVSVVLAVLFVLFAGPFILVLGSILITGRTM